MQDKPTVPRQPAPHQRRLLTPTERAKILARIIEIIVDDPGKPAVGERTAHDNAPDEHSNR